MLKYKGSWRFTPPPDGNWINQTIPTNALADFYDFIAKVAAQGNRQEILEHFKGAFTNILGFPHVWSSSEGWAEADLRDYMDQAIDNSPQFLEAFYDACISLSEKYSEIYTPDADTINALCVKHRIGYEIQPPYLVSREFTSIEAKPEAIEVNNNDLRGIVPAVITSFKQKQTLQVFLCHASGDKDRVRGLYDRLCLDEVNPWFDEEKLLPGQEWEIEIPKAVRASNVFIVCLSKKSISKEGYVQKEIKIALDEADKKPEGTIYIIPLRFEKCEVPDRLSKWHWVDYFDEYGYSRLLLSLAKRAEQLEKSE